MEKVHYDKIITKKLKPVHLSVQSGVRAGYSNKEAQDWEISDGRKYGQNP